MNDNDTSLQTAGFDDDWDDIDLSDLKDEKDSDGDDAAETEQQEVETPAEDTPEADQPEETKAEEAQSIETEQGQTEPEADQLFELKHLDERRQVTLEEMRALAQQGMDYARVREERDRLREHEEFLKELAGDGSVEDLIDEARAARLSDAEGIDRSVAIERVKLERERKAFEAEKQKATAAQAAQDQAAQAQEQQKAAQDQWRRDCILAFSNEFPDVEPTTIPKEVWKDFQNGETLVSAYRGYRLREMEQEMKSKQQAEDAAQRSAGSRQTAGTGDEMSEFDRLWYEDD